MFLQSTFLTIYNPKTAHLALVWLNHYVCAVEMCIWLIGDKNKMAQQEFVNKK